MSFVCPNCNAGKPAAQTVWRKPSRCHSTLNSARHAGKLVRCDGTVCGTCGQCTRSWEHKS